jgi:hypothetical protein
MSKRLEVGDVLFHRSYYHGYQAINIVKVTDKIAYTDYHGLKLRRDVNDKGSYSAYASSDYKYVEFNFITDDIIAKIERQKLESKAKMFFGNGMAENLPLRLKVEICQKYSPLRINIGFIDIALMSGSHEYNIDYLGCSVAVVDFDTDAPTVTLQRDGKDTYISTNSVPSRIYQEDAYVCVQCDEWQRISCGAENIPPFGRVKRN